ncbi:MAG TPA: PAS domain S-box protein [Syntrophales bacterium]|nr:PAS domain S-box protein [Syntrophales bacterium]
MAKSEPNIKQFSDLRERAEKKVPKFDYRVKASLADIQKLVHELRVHQIELEMQNDELRRSQVELTEERLKYADLYDFAPVGYFTLDKKGRIVETNVAGASLLGSSKRALARNHFQWFIPRWQLAAFEAHLRRAVENKEKQSCKLKLARKDGTKFDVLMDTVAVRDNCGNFVHFRLTLSDISEITAAEENLRQAQELHRSIVDNAGIGIVMIDADMKVLALNRRMQEWFPGVDVSKRPVCYKVFHDPPLKKAPASCPVYRTLHDGLPHEAVVQKPVDGTVGHYRIVSAPVRDKEGKVISAIKMVEDVTEHTNFHERLRESERRYGTIFETTGTATMIVEGDDTISLVNATLERWSGYSKTEIEGVMTWMKLVEDEADIERIKGYRRLRETDPTAVPKTYELRARKRNGDVRNVIVTVNAIPGTGRAVVSLLDISEMKRGEELLKKRERELEAESIALKVLLVRREKDKRDLEDNVMASVKKLIVPHVERIRNCGVKERDRQVNIIESTLKDIVAPFANVLSSNYLGLTAKEVEVAYLIRSGFTTKDIAESLNIARGTIEFHRENIRRKLDLKNKKTNLKSYLLTLS